MKPSADRRSFLKIAGTSLGIGVLYSAMPAAAAVRGEAAEMFNLWGKKNGERVTPFTFVQLSDAHVGFNAPRSSGHQSVRACRRDGQPVAAAPRPCPVYR